jgi:tRNA pseudouridine55 synthase
MAEQEQPHGILVVDKPEGMTSHDVVARVRRILKTKRVGHTGTLDPFATGVLMLLIGKATRLAQFIDKDEKEYEAVLKFGCETDTGDRTGSQSVVSGLAEEEIDSRLASVDWEEVFSKFRGEIEQVPPMYSAKKVEGKKLYELARAGKEIERKPVKIKITKLEILNSVQTRNSEIRIRVICSAGTYIRTLAEDIGRHIGIEAHLQDLRRTRAGRFDLSRSATLNQLELTQNVTQYLRPIEEAVSHLPEFTLPIERIEKTVNGLATRIYTDEFAEGDPIRMIGRDKSLVAVGVFQEESSQVKPVIVLA